ncbi:TcfC E-set like domain-containing protein [Aliivibrio sifiae]
MSKKHWIYITSLILLGSSFDALSDVNVQLNTVPKGFEDLIQPQQHQLSIVLAADTTLQLRESFIISGDHVTYVGSSEDLVNQSVKTLGIKRTASIKIVQNLIEGVDSSLKCVGFRAQCPLEPEDVDYVYVPANQTLMLHVNPKWMSQSLPGKRTYIDNTTGKSALIMNHELNYSVMQSDGDSSFEDDYSYYNNSYLGLGKVGYLRSSSNYSSINGLSADDISLNLLYENTRTRFGYIDKNQGWNNTAFLGNNTELTGYMASFGSSNELRRDSAESAQRVYFSIPRSGRLEVKNPQGRVLVSRNVEAGQQYLSYSELPKGMYSVTIRVYDGTTSVYNENRLIVNNGAQKGDVGDIDYLVSVGYLSRALTNTQLHDHHGSNHSIETRYDDYDAPFFSDAKVASRLTDRLTLGGGALVTTNDTYAYGGVNYWLFEGGKLSLTGGVFDDNSTYYATDLYIEGFSLTWRAFNNNIENNMSNEIRLSELLFNDHDFSSWAASYYYTIDSADMVYVSGNWNDNEDDNLLNIGSGDNQVWSVNTGYTLSGLPANTQATFEWGASGGNFDDNDYTFNINVTIPLSSKHKFSHNTFIDHHTSRNKTAVNHRDTLNSSWLSGENLALSTDVSTNYAFDNSIDNESDFSTSVSGSNDDLSGSGYFYLDNKGGRNGNIYLKTNTVTTGDRSYFTKDDAPSYLIVENRTGTLNSEGKFTSVVQERKNNQISNAYAISKAYTLRPLDKYSEYEFVVDDEASDFYNSGETTKKSSSYPGHVVDIKTDLGELKTFISTFVDIEGQGISDVECVGRGCVNTEKLTDGVYQFKVKDNLPYKLLSKEERCVIPEVESAPSSNLGTNFCMPSFEEYAQGYQIAKLAGDDYFYYVGKFAQPSQVETYKNKLIKNNKNIHFAEKVVDEYTYVFVKTDQLLTADNLEIISELMSYAVIDDDIRPYALN